MAFWVLFVAISYLFLVLESRMSPPQQRYFQMAFVGWLLFIAGFRYMIGWDYESYINIFSNPDGFELLLEPAILLFINVLNSMGFAFQGLFLLHSLLTLFFIYRGCAYYTDKLAIPLVMYALLPMFYWSSLGIIRQALAISILFWGSKYIVEHKFLKYLVVVAVASTVHYSAMLFIVAYFLVNREYKPSWHVGAVVVSSLLSIGHVTEKVLPGISGLVNLPVLQIYIGEASSVSSGVKEIALGLIWVLILINCHGLGGNKKIRIVLNMCTLSVVLGNLLMFSAPLYRTVLYYQVFYILGIGFTVQSITRGQWSNIAKWGFCLFAGVFFLYTIMNIPTNPEGIWHPYYSANNINYEFNFKLFQ